MKLRDKYKLVCTFLRDLAWDTEEDRARALWVIERAENNSLCNAILKDMYFCELEKGHDGDHEDGGLFWNDSKDGNLKREFE